MTRNDGWFVQNFSRILQRIPKNAIPESEKILLPLFRCRCLIVHNADGFPVRLSINTTILTTITCSTILTTPIPVVIPIPAVLVEKIIVNAPIQIVGCFTSPVRFKSLADIFLENIHRSAVVLIEANCISYLVEDFSSHFGLVRLRIPWSRLISGYDFFGDMRWRRDE